MSQELIKLYNPANAGSLNPDELAGLQLLTSQEIKVLAEAYPNATMQRAYLLIIDKQKPVYKQLLTLSSFENLYNLREKNGLRNYVAFGFKGVYKPAQIKIVSRTPKQPKKSEVIDLSDTELLTLPGFKTTDQVVEPTVVEKVKVKRTKKETNQKTE